jgi:UPF0716 family protein affecting phage T7 exclusion
MEWSFILILILILLFILALLVVLFSFCGVFLCSSRSAASKAAVGDDLPSGVSPASQAVYR